MDMSPLLREIVYGIVAGQADMRVVAQLPVVAPLREQVEAHRADALVFGDDARDLGEQCRELLSAHPEVKLFTLASDGTRTTLHELRPNREALGEVAPDELVAAIRDSVRATEACWE